jgi:hypothetical protein
MTHFDDLLRGKGRELPYPIMEECFLNVNDVIRDMRRELSELNFKGEYDAVKRKMPWFRFLQQERDKGNVLLSIGTRPVMEIK